MNTCILYAALDNMCSKMIKIFSTSLLKKYGTNSQVGIL